MRTTHCLETLIRNSSKKLPTTVNILDDLPPSKKQKIDHVTDFLHQISFLTTPQNPGCLPGLTINENYDKVTPLVKKFLDFKFNKTKTVNNNDSSFINNLSLDKIVDALLDTSDDSIRATVKNELNSSMVVNVESENENNINEEEQRLQIETVSEHSSDSGFRSSTNENSHKLDNNFLCKCNNNNNNNDEKTIIQINETYNERCVDDSSIRKRPSNQEFSEFETKKILLDNSQDNNNFTLKRQKGIRRRKPFSTDKTNNLYDSSKIDYVNTPIQNCYLENKEILGDTYVLGNTLDVGTPIEAYRGIRKCLIFDNSSKTNDSSIFSESGSTSKFSITDVRGSMDLKIFMEGEHLFVHSKLRTI